MAIDRAESHTFSAKKRFALKAAKDLCYSLEIIRSIKNATSEAELSRVLYKARNEN